MDPSLVAEFTELHAKAKSGALDKSEQERWNQLKQKLITQSSDKRPAPPGGRPISKPG